MKGFVTLGLLILAGFSLASPLSKNINGVGQKREAQDLDIPLDIDLDLDIGVGVKPREVSPDVAQKRGIQDDIDIDLLAGVTIAIDGNVEPGFQTPDKRQTQSDGAILNFALNLEDLEAELNAGVDVKPKI